MTPSFGIRQVIIIFFVFLLLATFGCVSSRDPEKSMARVRASMNKYMQTNPDAGEKSIYDSLKNKQYDEAIKQCERLRKYRPDDNDVYLLEGYAYQKKMNNFSIDRFSHIIDSDKSRGDAYYFRSYIYLMNRKFKKAINDITKALENIQTPDQILKFYKNLGDKNMTTGKVKETLYFRKAYAHHELGNTQLAMDNLNKAVEYASNSMDDYYNFRGAIYFKQHKFDLAYSDFEKALEIRPNLKEVWNTMGLINFLRGNYNEAVAQFQKANEINPKNMGFLTNMSLAYWLQGSRVKAFEAMGTVLRGKPNAGTFYHYAYFHHLNGNLDKAMVNFKKAYDLNPDILKIRATVIKRAPASSPTRKFYQDEFKTAKKYIEAEKTPLAMTNENRAPTLEITSVTLEPDPVPVNQAFDFRVKFKADIPGSKDNKIAIVFYFKVLQNNKILFPSKSYSIKVDNGKINTRTQHMKPVPVKGVYTIKVFVKYKELLAEKSIELVIN